MRIGLLADLSGTIARAIRHDHRTGVLHLVRLMQIRWLVGTGMPLRRVAEVLTGQGGDLKADVTQLLQALDDSAQRACLERAARRAGHRGAFL